MKIKKDRAVERCSWCHAHTAASFDLYVKCLFSPKSFASLQLLCKIQIHTKSSPSSYYTIKKSPTEEKKSNSTGNPCIIPITRLCAETMQTSNYIETREQLFLGHSSAIRASTSRSDPLIPRRSTLRYPPNPLFNQTHASPPRPRERIK